MRRLFSRILSVLVLSIVCSRAVAYDFQIDGIYYDVISSSNVEVTSHGDYAGDIVIPQFVTYQGTYSVTSIGRSAFSGCTGLTSITIPESVTSIGVLAFNGCTGLTNIIVEAGNPKYDSRNNCNAIIETATNELFAGCKNTTIPNSVTSIGDYAFYWCTGLTSVTIPNSVTSIGGSAFSGCTGLTSVNIPNSVTSIGDYAFQFCSGLTSVTIPNSVTSIGRNAFDECTRLTSVTIPSSVTSIGDYAFYWCTGLTSVTIPESVTSIGENAFDGCTGLTSVTIPSSVKSIEDYAFYGCTGLTSVTISSTTTVGSNAFPSTTKIYYYASGVSLNKSSLTFSALNTTQTLTATVSPSNAANKTLTWASSNTDVATVSSGGVVTAKGNGTATITAKTTDGSNKSATCTVTVTVQATGVTLNKTTLNFSALNTTQTLTAIVSPSGANQTVTWTSSNTNVATVSSSGVVTAKDNGTATITAKTTDGRRLTATCTVTVAVQATGISLNKTTLNFSALNTTQTLTATVSPSNAANNTLTWASSNTDVATVSSGGVVTAKGNGTATITAKTTDGSNKSATCTVTVTVQATGVTLNKTTLNFSALNTTQTLTATVSPDNAANKTLTWASSNTDVATVSSSGVVTATGYGTATITAKTTDGSNKSATCTVTVVIPVTGVTLNQTFIKCDSPGQTITLTATISPANANKTVKWSSSNTKVATVDANGKVSVVGEGSANIIAQSAAEPGIKAICTVVCSTLEYIYVGGIYYLPYADGHAEVTNMALGYDPGEEERTDYAGTINIPTTVNWNGKNYNVTGIHEYAFKRMKDLQSVVIPASVTDIGQCAFFYSEKLARVLFMNPNDSKLTRIRGSVFNHCSSLDNVSLPNSVNTIHSNAFRDCISLKKLQLSSSLTTIGANAFENCTALPTLNMPDKLSTVDDYAFNNCTSLTTIVFSPALYKINKYTFANCTSLPKIQLPEKLSFIDEFAFTNCTSLASAYLPESLGSIQNYAFSNDETLKEITFPSQLQGIGAGCFLNCTELQTVTFNTTIATMTVGADAFDGCTKLSRVNVKDLGSLAHTNFNTEKSNPLSLAHHLYQNNRELTTALVPESTMYVNNYAFSGCTSLKEINLPSTIQYVNDNIFYNCTALTTVRCKAEMVPPFIGTDDPAKMNNVFNKATLYVPKDAIEDYKYDDWWKRFKSVKEDDSTPSNLGDVNGDGDVNTSDVVAVYNFIIDGTGVTKEAADVNGDGDVNSTDVVAIYNLIISGNISGESAGSKSLYPMADGDDTEVTVLVGSTDNLAEIPVTVYLTNPTVDITAVEANLEAPVSVDKFVYDEEEEDYKTADTDRWGKKHTVKYAAGTAAHGANVFFISITNPDNKAFKEKEGAVVTVYFDGSELADGDYVVKMTSSLAVGTDAKSYKAADMDAKFSIKDGKVTAVAALTAEAAAAGKAVYTVDGKKVAAPAKGQILIVDGKAVKF